MKESRAHRLAMRSPHTFTIQYPPSRAYFRRAFVCGEEPSPEALLAAHERTLLYVHVPFCEQRCYYCNFAVDLRKSTDLHARYARALADQLDALHALAPDTLTLPGIDIGGGTPTRLEASQLAIIMESLQPWQDRLEPGRCTSIETTPSIASEHLDRLQVLVQGGVSRVSMGVQSTNDETLAMVNRRRQRERTDRALEHIARAGFDRVNVDLVFGLPGQERHHLRTDLVRVLDQGVDSVTIYDCLYRGKGRILPRLSEEWPSPTDYAAMYDDAYDLLTSRGWYGAYGGVNFSRHANESGTSSYFEGRLLDGLPYLGVGNYSSSLIDDLWCFAPYEVDDYLDAIARREWFPTQDRYRLPRDEVAAKYVLASLNYGIIDPARFERSVGAPIESMFEDALAYALSQGWLTMREDGVFAVSKGQFAALYPLRALFYSEDALRWVERNLESIWGESLAQATLPG